MIIVTKEGTVAEFVKTTVYSIDEDGCCTKCGEKVVEKETETALTVVCEKCNITYISAGKEALKGITKLKIEMPK
jgi:Zn finger protein HypA/HybF involved in hydrogenase expression